MKIISPLFVGALVVLTQVTSVGQAPRFDELATVAEKSGFTATCSHSELIEFQEQLAKNASHVSNLEIGRTVNGRSMLATVVAKPAYELGDSKDPRLVVLLLGNIHSGECAGKESLLMLLREMANDEEHRWLKKLVVVCLPNYNADGNDRIGRNEIHRPGQIGPTKGMGLRENAQQLDLNRDFMKIESPEARALVKLIDRINPHLFIDCHTTNGSRHRYQLTYDIPHNPTSPQPLRNLMRNSMMPSVTQNLEQKGISTFYYGNFSRDLSRWTTYGHEPRYSTEYVGLRGRLAVLSEAYSYISYEERINASGKFVTACIDYVYDNADQVRGVLEKIERDAATTAGNISLAAEVQPFDKKFTLKGYKGNTDEPLDVDVEFFGNYVPTHSRKIPIGYFIDQKYGRVVDRLLMHGIKVQQLSKDFSAQLDWFLVDEFVRSREFQKHKMVQLKGKWNREERLVKSGTYFVPTRQPLGRLAAYLLEPESNDGLVTWNFFDSTLEIQKEFPVYSLPDSEKPVPAGDVDVVEAKRKLTLDELYGVKGKIDFGGNETPELKWASNQKYRVQWNGRPVLVDVVSGNLERLPDISKRLIVSRLMMNLKLPMDQANKIADGVKVEVKGGLVLSAENDLYWIANEDDQATRLTNDDQKEELVAASPNGQQLAYVKANDLYRLDIASGKETRVTENGNENILNGKLDWVYQEELYGRGNFKGFWWSPDSRSLAYLTLDQTKVRRYRVTDNIPVRQSHEVYPYPKAGDPNPTVSLSVDGLKLDLAPFGFDQPLISQVCWSPGGEVYFQIQNRIQNVLLLVSWKPGQNANIVVKETAENGWLDSPGNPIWTEGLDGFVWFTHRGVRRHLAQYSSKGELIEAGKGFTLPADSPFEVRELVGATKDSCFYMAANPADATRMQLYRLGQDGKSTLVTNAALNHAVTANESLTHFFDFESEINAPPRVSLREIDGTFVRFIEPNLVDHLDYYEMISPQYQRVPTRDGDQMDSLLILPPDFDESKKYPVIMHVYSGPQAPRVRHRWGGTSYLWHQMMAQKGFVIWMCDNRSATHRGLDTAYPIYQDLGRRELMDIEDSLKWLKRNEWVDPDRIGIWGWSYGGYMTAYAMTHSKLFKAGISGAPVTDWRNYDSIYTERYMGLPEINKKGYDDSSVVKSASQLHGKMLIIHGTQDDNVHISNTYQLINALQNTGKQFELMIYPRNRHGIRVPAQTRHLRELMMKFFVDNL